VTFLARHSRRVLIAAAVPILVTILANLGRASAGSQGRATGPEGPAYVHARRAASRPGPSVAMPQVRLAQPDSTQTDREPTLSRNPFAFAPRRLPPAPVTVPVSIPPPVVAPPDIPPSLSLIGVATTTRADGRAERTAIISGPAGALYMVREADAVATRFRVDAVLPDSVTLVDGTTGSSLRLVLR